jgi:hypothetical protein
MPKPYSYDLYSSGHPSHQARWLEENSIFPSHASVSPGLTVIANALRVGDRLIEQLK